MLGDRGLVSPELENGSQAERGLLRRAEAGSNITIPALLSTYLVRLISGSQSTTDNATCPAIWEQLRKYQQAMTTLAL